MKIEKNNSIFSDAIVVLVLTANFYLAAYTFELSYTDYFQISRELISINLDRTLGAGVGILSFFLLSMFIINGVTRFLSSWMDNPKPYFTTYFVLHIYSLILFPLCYMAYDSFFYAIIVIIFIVIFVDLPGLLAALFRKISTKEKSFFKHWVEAHKDDKSKDIYQRIGERVGFNVNKFLLLFIVTVALAHASGSYVARNKTVFTVTDDMVLIRKYNDIFIFKEFDNKTKTLKNKIKVLDTAHVANLTLKQKTIKNITNQAAHNIGVQETTQPPRSN